MLLKKSRQATTTTFSRSGGRAGHLQIAVNNGDAVISPPYRGYSTSSEVGSVNSTTHVTHLPQNCARIYVSDATSDVERHHERYFEPKFVEIPFANGSTDSQRTFSSHHVTQPRNPPTYHVIRRERPAGNVTRSRSSSGRRYRLSNS